MITLFQNANHTIQTEDHITTTPNAMGPPAFLHGTALPFKRGQRHITPLHTTHPRAQLAGNIEDMPAELIPRTQNGMPPHWGRPGVYGVYSKNGRLQYVAAVADVSTAIAQHIRFVENADERYATRMITVDRVDDAPLGQIAESWVLAHAAAMGVPKGNGDDGAEWRMEAPSTDLVIDGDELTGIRRVVRENHVVLFMKGTRGSPRCGFSKSVVEALESVGGEFVCVDCLDERNGDVRAVVKEFSKWPTLPQLYVGGEFVGGADIVRGLVNDGALEGLLKLV